MSTCVLTWRWDAPGVARTYDRATGRLLCTQYPGALRVGGYEVSGMTTWHDGPGRIEEDNDNNWTAVV